ncbi:hypothetical protein [Inquilinus limosus]|uniref:Uncharacterized protein n=1 Tax=Inquilinus limosus TaxID=171674 RepID=A0A211ZH47_9PROT|nr:hypothetical protein [Inquilinus limosus]OWJ64516.1 hypothetical protein BWR60_24470 [Inquilinus limosus]
MTISNKIEFYLTPEHGEVVDCYDEEMVDSFDDFLAEQRGEKFSLRFAEGKVTFLPQRTSAEVVESLLREFIQSYDRGRTNNQ